MRGPRLGLFWGASRNCRWQRPLVTDKARHRHNLNRKISHFGLEFFLEYRVGGKATRVFTAEIGLGGTGPSAINGNLRPRRLQGSGTLSLSIGQTFCNHGSPRLISTRVSPVRISSLSPNCLTISPSFAPSWQPYSSNRMRERSNKKQGRMHGPTVGSDGDKVTNWMS